MAMAVLAVAATLVLCQLAAAQPATWPLEGQKLIKPAVGLPTYLRSLRSHELNAATTSTFQGSNKCGVKKNKSPLLQSESFLAEIERLRLGGLARAKVITIKVYVHNRFYINKTTKLYTGYIPASVITKQIDVLNRGFAGKLRSSRKTLQDDGTPGPADARIVFTLAGRYDWPTYSFGKFAMAYGGRNWNIFRRHARTGTCKDLNVFIHDIIPNYLGVANFPDTCKRNRARDGVFVQYLTVPGAKARSPRYTLGLTLVHETGHWFGLEHVFNDEGSARTCTKNADHVSDTPDGFMTFGCPAVVPDNCVGKGFPGKDPIRNIMDYVDDDCMWKLTPGQAARAYAFARLYRT